ncbi:hypothetical protein TDB9533_03179 [Thalassocella blandensis]|nr:hypothetical protein TDB9533_03179 [Thalassocella blandensis]
MPIDTIAEGIFGSILRFIGWVLVDVIFEFLVKGMGYLVCRPFKKVNPDGLVALLVGIVSWIFLGIFIYLLYDAVFVWIDVGTCLDSGGRFNYELKACEY